jgi:hypothetical protein
MKKVLIGIISDATMLRADSDPMSDEEADEQLSDVVAAKERGADTLVRLPWLVVSGRNVLFARSIPVPNVSQAEHLQRAARSIASSRQDMQLAQQLLDPRARFAGGNRAEPAAGTRRDVRRSGAARRERCVRART